ncbi:transketolase C-terminal domain-containing protein [uncultured Draconibacterium sp.]|uniref:transketolase family protein n=1 Tax=uncultured Draconibacterium sp. TaxID=1573823 RepID=UPI002AA6BD37|nr:transketolase C-terminal domain-containing protein [uncultured Draconibacterium sp.]
MSSSVIPCRKAFTNTILEEAKTDKNIFVVTSDARGSVTLDQYAKELPEQFVEVGIAEQNAVGVSAGLALSGNNVFVCGPACFYSARALEQVKVDIAYTNTNVKIIGVSGGVSYGALGATHHSLHDLAVMRTFPGMEVYLPADRFQTTKLIQHLVKSEIPAYVRMGRNAVPDVYTESDDFEFGKAKVLSEGKDIALIATGETVYHALKAAEKLAEEGIEATVVDLVSVKPFDEETVLNAIKNTKCVLTVEEHSIYGGVGAMVAELTSQEYPVKMRILGIPDENVINAKPIEILEYYGLTTENIVLEAKKLLGGL